MQQAAPLFDHLVGAGEQERWHIETIALPALSLFMPFSQSLMLTPFWAQLGLLMAVLVIVIAFAWQYVW